MVLNIIKKNKTPILLVATAVILLLLKQVSHFFILPLLILLGFSNKDDQSYRKVLILLSFVFLFVGMFSFTMNNSLGRDENMYLTASKLILSSDLYSDFAYFQTPYYPIIIGSLLKLFNVTHYLLVGRVLAFLFISVASILIYNISLKLTGSRFVALSSTIIFAMNDLVVKACGYSWNHFFPLMLTLLIVFLYFNKEESTSKPFSLFSYGLIASIALGLKLFYIVIFIPFFITLSLYPRYFFKSKRFFFQIIPFLGGYILGSFPIIILYLKNTHAFIFNNFTYHKLNTIWYQQTTSSALISISSKLKGVYEIFQNQSNLSVAALTIIFILVYFASRQKKDIPLIVFSFSLFICGSFIVMLPSPLQSLYLVFPITLMIILTLSLYNYIPNHCNIYFRCIFFTVALIAIFSGGPRLFRFADSRAINVNGWKGIQVHQAAHMIRQHIPKLHPEDKIATLSPLYAIEADLPIYSEFSTGPFLLRVGHLVNDLDKQGYIGISKNNLFEFFDNNKPRAILIGHDKYVDTPFIAYAKEREYKKISKTFDGLTLYISKN